MGVLVRDFYSEWADGPSRESLSYIKPNSDARRAVN
jgi:hypothetical protein